MPRASLGKLKNTIFSKQGLLLRLLQPQMTCQTRLEELKHTVDEPRHNIHSSVLAPLCAHNNILSFDRNSAKRQQQEPHVYVCMYIMNVLDSRESSVQIHEKNKFCDENVQFLCSKYKK